MAKIDSSFQNLVLSLVLVVLFNNVYYPITVASQEPVEKPIIGTSVQLMVDSPPNVLSGTVEDIKITLKNPEKSSIIVKGIEYRFNDFDSDNLYVSKKVLEVELWDTYETMLQMRIPEIYQVDKIAETDIPVSCTFIVHYEKNGVNEFAYISYNMYLYDRFLDTENAERLHNNEPVAIT